MNRLRSVILSLFVFFVVSPFAIASERAPDFTIKKLDGKKFRLGEAYASAPVLIHFWDTCCPDCREVLPDIDSLARAFDGKATILAIATDQPKSQGKVKPLVVSSGYRFDVAIDVTGEVRKLFGGTDSPLTLVIDQSGTVILRRVGRTGDEYQTLINALNSALTPDTSRSTSSTK